MLMATFPLLEREITNVNGQLFKLLVQSVSFSSGLISLSLTSASWITKKANDLPVTKTRCICKQRRNALPPRGTSILFSENTS